MKRTPASLLLIVCLVTLAGAAPLDREQRAASIRYVRSLQNTDGGFRPTAPPARSSLGATSSALRALKYLGGTVALKHAAREFVLDCYHPAAGAFSDVPGGQPDVRSTAMGLMAMVELKMPVKERGSAITSYFNANARTLPDIYIAAAALDAARMDVPRAEEWMVAYGASRNPDGSFGQGAPDAAGAIITTLRVGGRVTDREAALDVLRAAQRPDGGFAAMGDTSDLPTVYRVMRAIWKLKGKPDLARLREFIGRCRNEDGGYGPSPGRPSTVGTTYFAAIVLHWADEPDRR
jgi:prenyltransferase beta subunit